MTRFKKTWLVAGVGVVMLAGAAAIGWHLRTQIFTYYTDADAIRRPVDEVVPRDILWRPAVKLSLAINTAADEREPSVAAGGMTIFFVRGKPGFNADIFTSTRTPNGWTAPRGLDALNTAADELGPEPSPDGNALYFHSDRAGGRGGYDLWVSRRGTDGWQEPVNLGPNVNSAYHDYGPALAPDGETLYFASNRPKPDDVDAPAADAWLSEIRADYSNRDYDLYAAPMIDGAPGWAAAVVELNTPQNEGSPAVSSAGDFIYFCSDRPGGEGGYDIYRARLLGEGFTEPANLGDTLNTAANELDPALALRGFAVYFSSDRGSETSDGYDLYYAESREVFATSETYRASLDWASLWPYLLGMLLGLLGLLLSLLLLNAAHRLQYNRLSLLARCLLASLMMHLLLMLLFSAWGVTTALSEMFRQGAATRVALISGSVPGDLAGQVRGELTRLHVEAVRQTARRQEPAAFQAETQTTPATIEVARSRIEDDGAPDDDVSQVREAAAAVADLSDLAALDQVEQMTPAPAKLPAEAMRVDAHEAQSPTLAAQRVQAIPADVQQTIAIARDQESVAVAVAPRTVDIPAEVAEREHHVDAQPVEAVATQLPSTDAGPTITRELASVDVDVSIAKGPPAERVAETARTIVAETAELPRHAAVASGAPDMAPVPAIAVTPAASTYEPVGRSLAAVVNRAAPAQPQLADVSIDAPNSVDVERALNIKVAQPANVRGGAVAEVATGADLPVGRSARTSNDAPSSTGAASTAVVALAPDVRIPTGLELDSFAQPLITDSSPAAASDSPVTLEIASTFDVSAPVDVALPSLRSARLGEPVIKSGLPVAPNARSSRSARVMREAVATATVALTPEAARAAGAQLSSLAQVFVNDSRPAAASDLTHTAAIPTAFDKANPVDVRLPSLRTERFAEVVEPKQTEAMTAEASPRRDTITERADLPHVPATAAAPETRVVLVAPTVLGEPKIAPTTLAVTAPYEAQAATAQVVWPREIQPADQAVQVRPILIELALLDEFSAEKADETHQELPPRQEAPARVATSRFEIQPDQWIEPDQVVLDLSPVGSPIDDSIVEAPQHRIGSTPVGNTVNVAEPDVEQFLAAESFELDLKLPTRTALSPDIYKQRAPQQRQALVQQMGGSVETERAVAQALQWLARHQSADGRWDGAGFDDRCGACDGPTRVDVDIALTGLALLCFLGADHTHFNEGPYQEVVDRGLSWLVKQQRAGGDLMGEESMYSHGIATIALAEAFGMTGDPTLVEPVESAVRFIYAARNTSVGGWRYAPGQVGDTSVLGWQMMALTSARRCGLDVPGEAFDVAGDWLELVTGPDRPGLFAYQPDREVTPAMTAEAMFVHQLLGRTRRDQHMQASADYLLRYPPDWNDDLNTYYWYYATLALFQHQGAAWERWNERVKDQLVAHQRTDGLAAGSWNPDGQWAEVGGRVYQTAICALTLEVYYRYLPSFLSAETAEVPNMIRGVVTDATSGAPLPGAVIRVDRTEGLPLTATANASGRYVLITPDLPDFFAVSVSHDGYVPDAVNVASDELGRGTVTRDFHLDPMRDDVIAIEAVPEVHHLGNDRFDGRINSRFQRKAEGTIYRAQFELAADQLPPYVQRAQIVLMVKGAQVRNEIRINGNLLERFLDTAPRDGSFGEFLAEFPADWLHEGANTLRIKSVRGGDLDDFEFVNVRILLKR